MRHTKLFVTGVATAVLLTTAMEARGFGGKHHHQGFSETSATTTTAEVRVPKHRGILGQVFEISDLTDDQTTEIYTVLTEEREAIKTLQEEKIISSSITDVISTGGLDRDAFVEAEAVFYAEKVALKADTLETVLSLLTTTQIEELISLIETAEAELVDSISSDDTTDSEESNTTAE
jgi:Spy/CpxP family protein refolding chaperone